MKKISMNEKQVDLCYQQICKIIEQARVKALRSINYEPSLLVNWKNDC